MEIVRNSWTDERLDDLSQRMELGFAEVKTELRREVGSVRSEVGSLRQELHSEIGSLRQELVAIEGRLHSMQRTMIQFQGVMIAALIGTLATLVATQL